MRVLLILSLVVLGRMAPMQTCETAPADTAKMVAMSQTQSHDCCGDKEKSEKSQSTDCSSHCQNICTAPFMAAPNLTAQTLLVPGEPVAIPQPLYYSRALTVLDRPPIA